MTGPSLDLDALREKAEKATPGPWWVREIRTGVSVIGGPSASLQGAHPAVCERLYRGADAAYIAAASPDVILAVLALVDEQRKENERLREYYEAWEALRASAFDPAGPPDGSGEKVARLQRARESLAGFPAENKEPT